MCYHGPRFIAQLDYQRWLKRGNMTTVPQDFILSGFQYFCLVLFSKILQMSLRRFNFVMTFFGGSLKNKWWQSSSTKAGSIGTSISSKISGTFDSRQLSATLAGIPKLPRHSLLEYCSLAWHLFSNVASLSDSLEFTFLVSCILA